MLYTASYAGQSTAYSTKIVLPEGAASATAKGRISELRLRYYYPYRITDGQGRDLIAPGSVELFRDLTYDDSNLLAKQQEEALLWRDMETDLAVQLLRRLAAVAPLWSAAGE